MKKTTDNDTEKTLELAWKKFEKKDFQGADELFSSIPDEDEKSREGIFGHGACLLKRKEVAQAIEVFDKIIENEPDGFEGYHARAICHGADEEYEQSVSDLEKAIELAPQDEHSLYYDLGGTFLVTRDYKRAAQCFEKCIDIDNKCFEAWVGKALAAYFNKEQKAAFEFANIALKFNPKSMMALLLKAEVLFEMGKKEEANREVKKITAIEPDIFKAPPQGEDGEETETDDYDIDEDANRTEDDEIEEFDLDD